mmetsp:Transcript_30402/g.87685  ORF Transcript_30402/g.87685 Transcript_30402/m.87685 type:complete len:218 (+) Transcript_30402:1074-1727(+)
MARGSFVELPGFLRASVFVPKSARYAARFAAATVATRRISVTSTRRSSAGRSWRRASGTSVVLPQPVGLANTVTCHRSIAFRISPLCCTKCCTPAFNISLTPGSSARAPPALSRSDPKRANFARSCDTASSALRNSSAEGVMISTCNVIRALASPSVDVDGAVAPLCRVTRVCTCPATTMRKSCAETWGMSSGGSRFNARARRNVRTSSSSARASLP